MGCAGKLSRESILFDQTEGTTNNCLRSTLGYDQNLRTQLPTHWFESFDRANLGTNRKPPDVAIIMFGHIVSWVWLCLIRFLGSCVRPEPRPSGFSLCPSPCHVPRKSYGPTLRPVEIYGPIPVFSGDRPAAEPKKQQRKYNEQVWQRSKTSKNGFARPKLCLIWFDLFWSSWTQYCTSLLNRSRAKKPKSLQRSLSLRLHLESSHQEGNRAFSLVMRERERDRERCGSAEDNRQRLSKPGVSLSLILLQIWPWRTKCCALVNPCESLCYRTVWIHLVASQASCVPDMLCRDSKW